MPVERLERVPSYQTVILRNPLPALEYEKPVDLIARGEYLRVRRVDLGARRGPFS